MGREVRDETMTDETVTVKATLSPMPGTEFQSKGIILSFILLRIV